MGLILIGAAAMLFLMLFFVMGAVFGAKMFGKNPRVNESSEEENQHSVIELSEEEKLRLQEEQAALDVLLSFSSDIVYGINNDRGGNDK